jgi:NAD(P)-dependent dehydrogenase (short-subunit alcohol dehydrogenase family)
MSLKGFLLLNNFHPLGRNGQPIDVAEAILYLASDKASFITGVVLPIRWWSNSKVEIICLFETSPLL